MNTFNVVRHQPTKSYQPPITGQAAVLGRTSHPNTAGAKAYMGLFDE